MIVGAPAVLRNIKSGSNLVAWIFKSRGRVAGVAIIAAMIVVSLFQDSLMLYPLNVHFPPYMRPSFDHPLGTNDMGRDIFSEVVRGTRISLSIGLLAAGISLSIGTLVGVSAGYFRGKVEWVMLGLTDMVIVIPSLPLLLLLVVYLDPGILPMAIAISIVGWGGMARILHPRVLSLREMPFVETAKALGKSDLYIIVKHILPNCREILYAKFALAAGGAILAESSLSFLGLGDPLNLSWGGIINEAYTRGGLTLGLWWWYMVPGMLIALVILAFIIIGNSRDEDRWVSG